MKRWAIFAWALVPALSGCGVTVPDADAYITNPFKYQTLRGVVSVHHTWDEALAPVPCTSLKLIGKTWYLTGRIEANGILYRDGPLNDPAAAGAINQKFGRHIGPGC